MAKINVLFSLIILNYFLFWGRSNEDSKIDSKKYFISVIATFKNEASSIREWIEHHLAEGIDHIFLIDNGSDDNYARKVLDYVVSGKVSIKYESLRRQSLNIYNYFLEIKNKTEWMLLLDLDEYTYAPEIGENIKTILQKQIWSCENKTKKVGRIKVFWKNFASSFYKTQPELVIPNFIHMHNCNNKGSTCSWKTIIKTEAFIPEKNPEINCYVGSPIGVHWFSYDEENFCEVSAKPSIVLNHYRCQSVENWMRIKMPKGYLLQYNLDVKGFYEWDMNEYKDYDLINKKTNLESYKKLQDYCNALYNREIKINEKGEYYCSCQKDHTDINNQLGCVSEKVIKECISENYREMKYTNNIFTCSCYDNFYDLGFEKCVDYDTYEKFKNCNYTNLQKVEKINEAYICKCENENLFILDNKCISGGELNDLTSCSSSNLFLIFCIIILLGGMIYFIYTLYQITFKKEKRETKIKIEDYSQEENEFILK